ncbi:MULTISPECIES: glycosyltransferase family 2 protein [Erwinia]|uniref:dTDP-rhamnosyl transferase RfbF n=1 Tax=Erwinia rhapontici TaxID=55212 RepID=A0ABN6DLP6_ERWRD|nr:glycosyltransferase family 2 protein [Erwinia rhapontici]TDT01964.1 rhamnosyltransferase [Erwinia rhapontici]BCQ35693.1 dTDP-rhamnosyl transferase RfbF [Erwinia rhapontici]BCQ40601.1 dTDP-rhamnosyl transferase RfbF [Erwinia rhapontici]BCQ45884.1 dTDP-rhamnosyl transferase RfbF [Erwinia rhapontici]
MNKIITILVTYNPDVELLVESVNNLLSQTDGVIICNNSLEPLTTDLFENSDCIFIENFGENIGIAAAQSIGMDLAFNSHHADFILQMDQDSLANTDMVERLLSCYIELKNTGLNVGLVGAQDYDRYTNEVNVAKVMKGTPLLHNHFMKVSCILSSGSLIPKIAYEKVGGMANELFIDAVDHEYCWRLQRSGFIVVRNAEALLGHRLGDGKFKILNILSVGMPSPFRHYYAVRNAFILMRRDYVPVYWKLSSLAKISFKFIFYPVFLPEGKKRLFFISQGILDGLKNRTGKYKTK